MFEADSLSRTTMKSFLALQLAALGLVLGLRVVDLILPALAISSLTFLVFLAVLRWLYTRYQSLPVVREKRALQHLIPKFQKKIREEEQTMRAAVKERARLFQAEKKEIGTALNTLQRSHSDEGLAAASLRVAAIPGLGLTLRDRLIEQGIGSAADVRDRVPDLPGLGETERQALLEWRNSVLDSLERSRPDALPPERLEAIQKKYQALHDRNNLAERKALASVQILEHELIYFRPRLGLLRHVTFWGYVSKSLASRGMVAALIALLLIGTQIASSVSATTSSIKVSLTPSTPAATATLAPSNALDPADPGTLLPPR